MLLFLNGNFYIFGIVNLGMGIEENRYLVDCLNSLDELFIEQNSSFTDSNSSFTDLNIIEGGLILLGTFDSALNYSKKRNFSISKQPSDDLKIATLKNTIYQFNNYLKNQHSQRDFSFDDLLIDINHTSEEISQNKKLTRYVPPSKIDKTNNLFLYFKDSLFENNKLIDDNYIKWFLEDLPVSGRLRIGEELDRILSLKGLTTKKKSRSHRNKILCEEYDYMISQSNDIKKDFDLRYILNK